MKFSLLLIASIVVLATSTTLRGSATDKQVIPQRRQLQESTCTLYRKCVTYLPTKEHPNGYHKDSWACELSDKDSKNMGVKFVDIVETDFVTAKIGNATSGEATLTMSEAIVDTKSPRMFIPHDASIMVESRPDIRDGRRLAYKAPSRTGTLNTLVIRVLDKNNVAPDLDIATLRNDVFDDGVSLKTQAAACSYNKLQIKPFVGKTPSNKQVVNGIVEVKMDYAMGTDAPGLDQAAMKAANEQLGNLDDSMFDLVLFCFPPGNNFLAFAYPNTKYSFYNNKFCGYVGAQLHEVGHNLGLGHSGQINENGDYGDITGVMGAVPPGDDLRMCYNPQKSYQLGWYNDQVETIDPLDGVGQRKYILNGLSDYKKNKDALIVLQLRQTKLQTQYKVQQDFYIGFNRATGINADTAEDRNLVTVVRKEYGSPDTYGQSTKLASLSVGKQTVLKNFNGERDVYIKFEGIENGRDAKITVIDPNPAPPKSCMSHRIEIKTDNYPQDTSWNIVGLSGNQQGTTVAAGSNYDEKKKVYTTDACLVEGQKYQFRVIDSYGDGMGEGYFRVTNNCGNEVVYGGNTAEKFKEKIQSFTAKCSSGPDPTKAPTRKPTPMPSKKPTPKPTTKPATPSNGACEKYTVEVKTDNYPVDNSWYINDSSGDKKFSVDSFSTHNKVYTKTVCLNYNSKYEFTMLDEHKDGMCCKYGEGYYKVMDSKGTTVIDSTKETDQTFEKRNGTINVGPPPCKDKYGKFKLKKRNKFKRTCKFLAKKKKCNAIQQSQKVPVWKLCPAACNRCMDL